MWARSITKKSPAALRKFKNFPNFRGNFLEKTAGFEKKPPDFEDSKKNAEKNRRILKQYSSMKHNTWTKETESQRNDWVGGSVSVTPFYLDLLSCFLTLWILRNSGMILTVTNHKFMKFHFDFRCERQSSFCQNPRFFLDFCEKLQQNSLRIWWQNEMFQKFQSILEYFKLVQISDSFPNKVPGGLHPT